MDSTFSSQGSAGFGRSASSAHELEAEAPRSIGSLPPRRVSTFPKLEDGEAQDRFLRSPAAVIESLGIRVPAALAQHLQRRSSVPPPPAAPASASGPSAAVAPLAEMAPIAAVAAAPIARSVVQPASSAVAPVVVAPASAAPSAAVAPASASPAVAHASRAAETPSGQRKRTRKRK